ncbi:MAG: glycosyltransferase family 4 protein [Zetaproteobacteria bacterium]|nr:glycosyltransferase family 4 protein [Zetaproteobacteria bacterium]
MNLINWQANFTEHQSHTWAEIQRVVDEEVVHIVATTSSELRKKQGWSTIDLSQMKMISFERKGWWKLGTEVIRKHPGAIHVFGGFWADKRFFPLIIYAIVHGNKVAVMNEPFALDAVGYLNESSKLINRLKVKLRPWVYKLTALLLTTLSKPNQLCILALSDCAEEQFIRAGFLSDQVFPFGYFVPKLEYENEVCNEVQQRPVKLIFVGSLLKRKGLDYAVYAVEALHAAGLSVSLDIYGHGESKEFLSSNSQSVSYKGEIPFGQSQKVIAEYDALILPSLHDGWGVVVNESLLQGIPVIASSNVGAKCMIEESGAGMVFESGNQDSLLKLLNEFCTNASLRGEQKRNAKDIGALITPKNAANYMKDVFEFYYAGQGERPKRIWCRQS